MAGVAAMAAAGAYILVEDDFVSGPAAQQRRREALRAAHVWDGEVGPDLGWSQGDSNP